MYTMFRPVLNCFQFVVVVCVCLYAFVHEMILNWSTSMLVYYSVELIRLTQEKGTAAFNDC